MVNDFTNLAAGKTFLMPHVSLGFHLLRFKDFTLASRASLIPLPLDATGLISIQHRGVVAFFVAILAIHLLIMYKDLKLERI